MTGRKYTVFIFALLAVLIIPGTGFSKKARTSKKGSEHHRKATKTAKPAQKPAATENYTIQPGDSLFRIAKAYQTTPKALKTLNNLSGNRIKVGQAILVPVVQSAAVSAATSPANSALHTSSVNKVDEAQPEAGSAAKQEQSLKVALLQGSAVKETVLQDYKVRRGDNLSRIAKSFKITPKALQAANHFKGSRLKAGQIIKVPVERFYQAKESLPAKAQSKQLAASQAAFRAERPAPDPEAQKLPLRERLVEAGFNMLGIRYRFSGTSEKTGLDCSAMVKNLFSKFDIHLPRSSREQYQQGQKIARENLEIGDLVFFSSGGKTPTHVGVYIGNNKFLHAARKAKQVIVSDLNKYWYEMRYLGARRIMNLWWEEPEVPSGTESGDKK